MLGAKRKSTASYVAKTRVVEVEQLIQAPVRSTMLPTAIREQLNQSIVRSDEKKQSAKTRGQDVKPSPESKTPSNPLNPIVTHLSPLERAVSEHFLLLAIGPLCLWVGGEGSLEDPSCLFGEFRSMSWL